MEIIISLLMKSLPIFGCKFYHAVRREYNNEIFVHNDTGLSFVIKKNDQKFLFENRTNVREHL